MAVTEKKDNGGFKEWLRKSIVSLKRQTHIIPLVVCLICSVFYLLCLRTLSKTVLANYTVELVGLCVFVNTLFSVLVLALFLSAFPKRKPVNIVMLCLIYGFLAVMAVLDVVYVINMQGFLAGQPEVNPIYSTSVTESIVHIVLLGVTAVVLALLPIYSKLIMNINTKKDIEDSQLNETIDTSEEE